MALFNQQHVLRSCVVVALLLFPCRLLADEVLVVIGANSPSITLSRNQVSDLFLGKVGALPDGRNAVPVDQLESNPIREEFYIKVTNKSAPQAKALWAKLYFTGRGVPPREGKDSSDVKRIVNSTPGAIGYIERSSLDSTVKVIFVSQ